jgi:hypothetical protein
MPSEDKVKWEDSPEYRTLCRGCKRFTPRQVTYSYNGVAADLGICKLPDSIFSVPVGYKETCPQYECNYLTRYQRIAKASNSW